MIANELMNRLPIMKTKLSLITAIPFLVLALSVTALAQTQPQKPPANPGGSGEAKPGTVLTGGGIVATPITKEEAAKKCPMQKGNYPMGERDSHQPSGWINSPFPPRTMYDCSKIGHGELVLDTHVNRVFTRP
jgi:hypothetical protein